MTARDECDVAIIGGGPAGSAAALSLRRQAPDLRVTLIETSHYRASRIGETLPPPAERLLRELGVWESFLGEGQLPSWGTRAGRAGTDLRPGTRYLGHRRVAGGLRLRLRTEQGERELGTRFAIDASGLRAVFARREGAWRERDDTLVGIHGDFNPTDTPCDTTTLVESCEDGWWYSALLPDRRWIVCYFSDADLIRARGLHRARRFLALLAETEQISARCRDAKLSSAVRPVAAASSRLDNLTGEDWLAAGDAASTFDPLSSAGIQKALSSGILAAYAALDTLRQDRTALIKYRRFIAGEHAAYLELRRDHYRREVRWPDSFFWQRRQLQKPAGAER